MLLLVGDKSAIASVVGQVDNLVITHIFLFAPEAQRKLAGGETTGKPVIIAFAPWQGRRTGA